MSRLAFEGRAAVGLAVLLTVGIVPPPPMRQHWQSHRTAGKPPHCGSKYSTACVQRRKRRQRRNASEACIAFVWRMIAATEDCLRSPAALVSTPDSSIKICMEKLRTQMVAKFFANIKIPRTWSIHPLINRVDRAVPSRK